MGLIEGICGGGLYVKGPSVAANLSLTTFCVRVCFPSKRQGNIVTFETTLRFRSHRALSDNVSFSGAKEWLEYHS